MELLAESSLFVDKLKSMCNESELSDFSDLSELDNLPESMRSKTGEETTIAEEVVAESAE
jgi:hypothetical protein